MPLEKPYAGIPGTTTDPSSKSLPMEIHCVTQAVYPELATSTGVKVFSGNTSKTICRSN